MVRDGLRALVRGFWWLVHHAPIVAMLLLVPRPAPVDEIVLPEVVIEVPVVVVLVTPPAVEPANAWRGEIGALATAFLEAQLLDLEDVVPRVGEAPASPAVRGAPTPDAPPWKVWVEIEGEREALQLAVVACPQEDACTRWEEPATYDDPVAPMARLGSRLAEALGHRWLVDPARWSRRETADSYAQLLAGRAAASVYGTGAPVDPEHRGDRRRDPVARAVFVDPRMSVAERLFARTDQPLEKRRTALDFALEVRPDSPALLAEMAVVEEEAGDPLAAWARWAQVAERAPNDQRFRVPMARSALAAGQVDEAATLLASVSGTSAEIARLRVLVADRTGPGEDYDALLADWQANAPTDPEPVRRRIQLRVRDGRASEALGLLGDLADRGAERQADELSVALAAAVRDWPRAAAAARRIGRPDVASRMELLAGAEVPESEDPLARVARARVRIEQGRPGEALVALDEVLTQARWLPEALDARARALDGLGRADEAAETRARLSQADPFYPGFEP